MKLQFGKPAAITTAQLRDGIAEGITDGYIDHDGSYRSRSGVTNFVTIGSDPIDGIYSALNDLIVIVTGGQVYVSDHLGNYVACSGSAVSSGNICTFAEDGNYVYIGHGGRIAKVDTQAKTVELLDSDTAPDNCTHVAYLQGYLFGNGTNGIAGDTFYTGPSTVEDYLTTWEVYNNESLPDDCQAIGEDGQFLYAFGSRSVEVSNNDGVTPWAKYSLSYIPYGITARYSLAKLDNSFFWLGIADNAVRVLRMVGGAAKAISTPYDAIINDMAASLSGAYGFGYAIDGHSFYVLTLSEDMTLVYHLQSDAWYRWGYFDLTESRYTSFVGRSNTYSSVLGKNVLGGKYGGLTGISSGFTDFDNTIRFELTSGNFSGNTYKQKRAGRMRLQLQRGMTTDYTSEPVLLWSHRDNGGAWSPQRTVSLGLRGNYDYLAQIDRTGVYRQRQHRFTFTDPTCQLIIVSVEEDSTLLED